MEQKQLTLMMPPELLDELRHEANRLGYTVKDLITCVYSQWYTPIGKANPTERIALSRVSIDDQIAYILLIVSVLHAAKQQMTLTEWRILEDLYYYKRPLRELTRRYHMSRATLFRYRRQGLEQVDAAEAAFRRKANRV